MTGGSLECLTWAYTNSAGKSLIGGSLALNRVLESLLCYVLRSQNSTSTFRLARNRKLEADTINP